RQGGNRPSPLPEQDMPSRRQRAATGARQKHQRRLLHGKGNIRMTQQRLLLSSMLVACVGMFIACGGVSREEANKRINEADALWEKGDKAGAISKYKAVYTEGLRRLYVSEYEATGKRIFPRIVEYEVKTGNIEEAKTWIKRGLSDSSLKD